MYPCITFIVLGGNYHCEKIMDLLIYLNILSICIQFDILHNSSVLTMMAVGFF